MIDEVTKVVVEALREHVQAAGNLEVQHRQLERNLEQLRVRSCACLSTAAQLREYLRSRQLDDDGYPLPAPAVKSDPLA